MSYVNTCYVVHAEDAPCAPAKPQQSLKQPRQKVVIPGDMCGRSPFYLEDVHQGILDVNKLFIYVYVVGCAVPSTAADRAAVDLLMEGFHAVPACDAQGE